VLFASHGDFIAAVKRLMYFLCEAASTVKVRGHIIFIVCKRQSNVVRRAHIAVNLPRRWGKRATPAPPVAAQHHNCRTQHSAGAISSALWCVCADVYFDDLYSQVSRSLSTPANSSPHPSPPP
jgi:hypothetical protein